jgi:hypothetical protein
MAHVIVNRANSGWQRGDYDKIVWQKNQFSFTRNDPREKGNRAAYDKAASGKETSARFGDMAKGVESVYTGENVDETLGATYYYSPRSMSPPGSQPHWNFDKLIFTQSILDQFNAYRCANGKGQC